MIAVMQAADGENKAKIERNDINDHEQDHADAHRARAEL